MLKKFKILIYENFLQFIFSFLITLTLWKKIIFLMIPLGFFSSSYFLGLFGSSFFFTFLFLPQVYFISSFKNLPFLFYPLFFLMTFLFLKKIKYSDWLLFLSSLFLIFLDYRNFFFWLPLVGFFFNLIFLKRTFFSSLVFALIFLETAFLLQFFSLNLIGKTILILVFMFLLRYDIIKI